MPDLEIFQYSVMKPEHLAICLNLHLELELFVFYSYSAI